MSKIKQELLDALEINQKKGETDEEVALRIVRGVVDLTDDEWASLSEEAQNWYNDAADAVNDKKDVPAFPDAEPAAEPEKPAGRRGRTAKEDPKATAKEPEVGDQVKVTTKRGKVLEGELLEIDEDLVVLQVGDDEEEFDRSRIDTIEVLGGDEPAAQNDNDAPSDKEPEVGDQVKIITKRGKEAVGKLIEIDGDIFVLDVDGDEVEIDTSTAQSVEVLADEAEPEKPASGRRGRTSTKEADKPKDTDKQGDKPRRITSAANGGVSATTRMRELIVENIDSKKDEIAGLLKKEKIDFKDNTLDLVFADTHKILAILKERKLLKA